MPTPFATQQTSVPAPQALAHLALPRRQRFHPSPGDWRDEILYFLLVDRFSDAREATRPLLDRANRAAARPAGQDGQAWRWDRWAESGASRWQGGTLAGVHAQLGYLADLGITAIWLSPVFKQRGHLDSFHGYGIQDFLDVDPRLGTRADLVALCDAAHQRGIRIILDIIFNHSGFNWVYPGSVAQPPYRHFPDHYDFGAWLDRSGAPIEAIADREQGVWPRELQDARNYTRAGMGDLGAGDIGYEHAEHKRTDFFTLRDFALDAPGVLGRLADCYKYWIALTDCDGFRIDTLKHVSLEEGRNFCGAIKEFAANLGKSNFFLVGEVAGGDYAQKRYLDVLEQNLNAALDIGEMRLALNDAAKGLAPGGAYFAAFAVGKAIMGSHRNLGSRHVSILDDHDHVFGAKLRFSAESASEHQVVAGVALQLFTLGIPCVYYGTEQAFAGPEPGERPYLPSWKGGDHADRYLREAMFGPRHPRRAGLGGLDTNAPEDTTLPGFGPFGTAGAHCFDPQFHVYQRIASLAAVRARFPVLRVGRQYPRPTSLFGRPFSDPAAGELFAWSRILTDEEALVLINAHGNEARGADVLVDAELNAPGSEFVVVANSEEAGRGSAAGLSHPVGSRVTARARDGVACVEVRNVPPSGVLVLVNRP